MCWNVFFQFDSEFSGNTIFLLTAIVDQQEVGVVVVERNKAWNVLLAWLEVIQFVDDITVLETAFYQIVSITKQAGKTVNIF